MTTVLITQKGHQAYLPDAVQSIINQTYQDWELVILNDEYGAELGWYTDIDKRVDYYAPFHVKDGQPAKLNLGIKKAKGDYIAFQDADDISFPYRLRGSLDYFEKYNCDMVYGDKIFLYPDRQDYWQSPEWNKNLLHKRPTGAWGSYMIRTELARQCPFDESVSWGNDHIFEGMVAVKTDKIIHIPLPLYKQRTYSSTYRTCKMPIYRKMKRLWIKRKINKRVERIVREG